MNLTSICSLIITLITSFFAIQTVFVQYNNFENALGGNINWLVDIQSTFEIKWIPQLTNNIDEVWFLPKNTDTNNISIENSIITTSFSGIILWLEQWGLEQWIEWNENSLIWNGSEYFVKDWKLTKRSEEILNDLSNVDNFDKNISIFQMANMNNSLKVKYIFSMSEIEVSDSIEFVWMKGIKINNVVFDNVNIYIIK